MQVSVRGCPWVSLLTRLEEGCTSQLLDLAGVGRVQGEVCLCGSHLCNSAHISRTHPHYYLLVMLLIILTL